MAQESPSRAFPFHASTKEECFKHLGVSDTVMHHRSGLTDIEAADRLQHYGSNKLSEKEKVTIWQRIWHQVANVLVGILVFVALVSAGQAIRFATVEPNKQNVITNWIQVALIAFVIMYVSLRLIPFVHSHVYLLLLSY
jgi:magnesium-transporting ATPase (P-type)